MNISHSTVSRIAQCRLALGRLVGPLAAALLLLSFGPTCQAGSWVFRPSYYTHHTPGQMMRVPVDPPASSRVLFTRPQGSYIRGGYRNLNLGTNVRSMSDNYRVFEYWIQGGQQF